MFKHRKLKLAATALLLLTAKLFLPAPTQAQQSDDLQPSAFAPQVSQAHSDLGRQLEQLRAQLDHLESLVRQQQQALADMNRRLVANEEKALASALGTTSPSMISTTGARTEDESLSSIPTPTSTQAAGQTKKQSEAPLVAGWDDNHAFLRSADGSFLTYLTGYGQLDFRGYQAGNHPANTFLVRRARLALEGKLARYYEFKLEGDFADTSSTLLRDFYVRVHRHDSFQLTAGQFKEPFSQEELRGDAFQDFVERSLVNNLAPSRSPGIMVSGVLGKGAFEYQVGAFNGKGLLATNLNGTPEGVVRLRLAPWKSNKEFWLNALSFGGAYAQGRSDPIGVSVRGLTESRSFIFFIPDTIRGSVIKANGELTWLLGPAAFRAEYAQTNQARSGLGPAGTTLPGVVAKGYMGQFTYLLTGEKKPDSSAVSPRHNLFGDVKNPVGFGAWELKVRYANLQISDGTAKSNRAETIYFGPNWYLNRFVRYLLDFGWERYRDPLRTPNPGDKDFFVVLSRIQLAF